MIATGVLIWFFVTILMMAFFAGMEMAFFSVNKLVVELKRKQGKGGAELLSRFVHEPVYFVGTTLIGYTLFLVFFVLLFNKVTQPMWNFIGLYQFEALRLILDIALATFVVMVLADFMPRAIFRSRSNILFTRFIWVFNFFYQILQPLAAAFIGLSNWILRYVFNVKVNDQIDAFTRADTDTLFQQNAEDEFEAQDLNTELFENASKLPKIKIRQCLVPRKEIIGIDSRATIEAVCAKLIETKLSKLIVYEGNIDTIIGYVHQLDLFKNPIDLQSILLPIPAVPESMSATDLINKFTRERKSIAWVVDEFGGTAGIVTMEDVLEEIFGEIHDEYDSEEFVEKQIAENEYIFSGRLELDFITRKYDLQFTGNDSETLSGYIINHHETIPQQKERIIIDDYEFDVLSVSDTRIEMVKLKILK
ncbi:MAG TPA: hemolysin family protein [Chitinophagaceae bacterium]|nr:hemolysin family protein [Chitinophagaceae bacterium]